LTHETESPIPDAPCEQEDLAGSGASPSGVIRLYLASVRDRLIREMEDGAWPKCYLQGQFWIYPPDPYFAMHKAAHSLSGLNPELLYHPPIFLWLPHILENTQYTCPMSICHNYKSSTRPLAIKGWNDNPIAQCVVALVVLDGVYYTGGP
jgi:hypothetical protein